MAEKLTEPNQNRRPFRWSKDAEQAAQDVADDQLTDSVIADRAKIAKPTLYEWKRHPEFAAKVAVHQAEIRETIRKRGIAIVEHRVRALDDRWRRMQSVIEARAADPAMALVPGGDTGLLVHNVKGVGKGEDFQLIDLYEVDTGLLREIREHERQAAQELGQWTESAVPPAPPLTVIIKRRDDAGRKPPPVEPDP